MNKKITREEAIKIIDNVTCQDDPYWENIIEDWADPNDFDAPLPTIYDVLEALGVTKEEYKKVVGEE